VRVDFVYANPRRELAVAVARGDAPDTALLGENHLHVYGIDAGILDSRMRRGRHLPGLVHRLTWLARELAVPWETKSNVVVTPLATMLPIAARAHRGPRVVLLNISLCTTLRRLRGVRRAVLEASLRSAHAIVCLAAAQRDLLLQQVRVDPRRVHVALLGVDDRYYTPRPEPDEPRVLAVGRDLGRDYATFVRAVRDLAAPATIVASARNLTGIELPPNVEVELDVTPGRLRELYAAATCVVVPTRAGEFDRGADCSGQTVALDAMAMGRPAVVTRRATLAEYVDDGETALVVPPEDPSELRRVIARLLDDRALRERLGAAARAKVEAAHTTRRFASELAGILREAA
jgi:glycosyltransferase involved in cell wall biosynthesis